MQRIPPRLARVLTCAAWVYLAYLVGLALSFMAAVYYWVVYLWAPRYYSP